MSINCWHPTCDKPVSRGKHVCGKHWALLSDELRSELRRLNQAGDGGDQVRAAIEDYFAERMVGEHEITRCRGAQCGADIIWMQGFRRDGSVYRVPVDARSVTEDDIDFDRSRHSPHWQTCPNANDSRKGR